MRRPLLPVTCSLRAGVFDGHSGAATADWLVQHLYEAFSQEVDDSSLQDGTGSGAHTPVVLAPVRHTAGGKLSRRPAAAGLACPIELTSLLSDIFTRLDKQLLQWLAGACASCSSRCSPHTSFSASSPWTCSTWHALSMSWTLHTHLRMTTCDTADPDTAKSDTALPAVGQCLAWA